MLRITRRASPLFLVLVPLLCSALSPALAAEDGSVEVVEEGLPLQSAGPAPAGRPPGLGHALVDEARALNVSGRRSEAIELLETYVFVHPDDEFARRALLQMRIAEREGEMRALLTTVVDEKEFVLGDPGYEAAKARAPLHIARQLDVVEYLVQDQQFTKAIAACRRILDNHADNEATLTLLDRLLTHLLRLERRRLEADRRVRNTEVENEIIEAGTMPREKKPLVRTVLIFDEDIAEIDRQRVLRQLSLEVRRIKFEEAQLREILRHLFALAGLNYVILDEAVGQQTLTIDLVDENIGHVLEIITRMTAVELNYRGGSVYVTSRDGSNRVLVTEIIRLQSGLTDVLTEPQLQDVSGGGRGGQQQDPSTIFGGGGGGDPGAGLSDLERFLEKALADGGLIDWPAGSEYYLDHKSNTLYVRSTPASISEVKRLMAALDFNSPQVLIEARFVEVSTNAMENLGISWQVLGQDDYGDGDLFYGGGRGGPAGMPFADLLTGGTAFEGGLTTGGEGLAIGVMGSGNSNAINFKAVLHALEKRGNANTLSEPKILTLSNAWGLIRLEEERGYISNFENRTLPTQNQGVNPINGNVITQQQNVLVPVIEKEPEFIQLRVRPSVARNSNVITLVVQPTIRQFIGNFGGGGFSAVGQGTTVLGSGQISEPLFATRQLGTVLHVQDGQTVVLGGLVSENDSRDKEGIPGLMRIPGLGRLFRKDGSELRRSKLLVFVTAHIIDPNGAKYSEEVRHLRDAARIVLPAQAREQLEERRRVESEAARERAAQRLDADNGGNGNGGRNGPTGKERSRP